MRRFIRSRLPSVTAGGGPSAPTTGGLNVKAGTGSSPTVPSDSAPGTVLTALSVEGFQSSPTFSVLTGAGKFAVSGTNLVAGQVALDYTQAQNDTVLVRATGSGEAVERTLSVIVGPPVGPTAPSVDLNFVTGFYAGASLSNLLVSQPSPRTEKKADGTDVAFGPNTPRVTDLGLAIRSQGAEYLAGWAMDPDPSAGHWQNFKEPWSTVTYGPPVLQSGFETVLLSTNNGAEGLTYPPMARDLAAGETVTIKLRAKAAAGRATDGLRVAVRDPSGAAATLGFSPDISVANPTWQHDTGTFISGAKQGDGSYEAVIRYTAPSAGLYRFGMSTLADDANGQVELWGLQVVAGTQDQAWVATEGSGFTETPDAVTLSGALAQLLTAPSGTIVLEIAAPTPVPGVVLKSGSLEIMELSGWTSLAANDGATEAVVGIGGFMGIARIGIARDATGFSLCVNGGDVATSTSAIQAQSTVELFPGLTGRVRRIIGWSSRLPAADLKRFTDITNRVLLNPGNGLALGKCDLTFEDDFDTNTIAVRDLEATKASPSDPADGSTFKVGSKQDYVGYYRPDVIANGKKWMPRYEFSGLAQGTIMAGNGQYELLADPQYPWADGYTGPFSIADGKLTITMRKADTIGPNLVAQMPNRIDPAVGDTGQKLPYISGGLISAPSFSQKFGYFEIRAKVPKGQALWPAFWMNPDDLDPPPEIDILEYVGRFPTQTTGAVHWVYDGVSKTGFTEEIGIDLSQDFHTYGALWEPGFVSWFLDGKLLRKLPVDPAVDASAPMFMLLNLSVGDVWGWIGTPDETTPTMAQYVIDWVRVRQR